MTNQINNQPGLFDKPPVKAYFNTIPLEGKELVKVNEKSCGQELLILKGFQDRGEQFDANGWEVSNWPEVTFTEKSVRRSLTNLKDSGYLRFSGQRRKGEYSIMNKCYELTQKGKTQKL